MCSELDCRVAGPASSLTPLKGQARWFSVGDATILALQAGRLVEYDMLTRCVTATDVVFSRMNISRRRFCCFGSQVSARKALCLR